MGKALAQSNQILYVHGSGGGPPMQEFSINGPFGEMDSDNDDYFSFISRMPESTTSDDSCQTL